MNQFFATLPKTVIAIGALVVGLVLILLNDPPRTVCDTQLELFRSSQKRFLYSKIYAKNDDVILSANEKYETCRENNDPGGCFDFFQGLKKMNEDLGNIPAECSSNAAGDAAIQEWVFKSLKLMVQMAWGDRAPASYMQKQGWFDSSDLVLYCDLMRSAQRIFGKDQVASWQEGVLQGLPQADKLSRESAWQKTILSTPCHLYR